MTEREIDLQAYIELLLKYWKWVLGSAFAAAGFALVFSLLLPPTYEASSLMLVTEPLYTLRFDPRFGTEEREPANQAFPILATSDDVLLSILTAYTPLPEAGIETWNLKTLSEMVDAQIQSDPSLVSLEVRSRSAQEAANIANAWADVLLEYGNELYGRGTRDVAFFEEQVEQALQALAASDAALIEFEARNQITILKNRLDSLSQTQADYLDTQRRIAFVIQDIQRLQVQYQSTPGDRPVSLADDLTVLLLQITALSEQSSIPFELQVTGKDSLSDLDRDELLAFLNDLAATLETQLTEIDDHLVTLEPQILALQQQLESLKVEKERLNRSQSLARETYVTLSRKLDEARIASKEDVSGLEIGSYAAVPTSPSGPRKLINVVVGGALGLILGLVLVVLLEIMHSYRSKIQGREES